MRILNQAFIARHVRGGLKCFSDDHPNEAQFFPKLLWGLLTSHLVRAQWCVIAGANRMEHLVQGRIKSHSQFAFESIVAKYPGLGERYMPRLWWPSVSKRGVWTLWPELLKIEAMGTRPTDGNFKCDWCMRLAVGRKQTA